MHIRTDRRGFTLIELLVVIAIVAILAGMLLPALARARLQAQLAKCQGNMKQVGLGIQIYSDNNRGILPAASAFPTNMLWDDAPLADGSPGASRRDGLGLVTEQVGNIRVAFCPTDSKNNADEEARKVGPPGGQGDAYCSFLYRQHSVGSGNWTIDRPGTNPAGAPIRALAFDANVPFFDQVVHKGESVSVLFYDGHVTREVNGTNSFSLNITSTDPMQYMLEIMRVFQLADGRY